MGEYNGFEMALIIAWYVIAFGIAAIMLIESVKDIRKRKRRWRR